MVDSLRMTLLFEGYDRYMRSICYRNIMFLSCFSTRCSVYHDRYYHPRFLTFQGNGTLWHIPLVSRGQPYLGGRATRIVFPSCTFPFRVKLSRGFLTLDIFRELRECADPRCDNVSITVPSIPPASLLDKCSLAVTSLRCVTLAYLFAPACDRPSGISG